MTMEQNQNNSGTLFDLSMNKNKSMLIPKLNYPSNIKIPNIIKSSIIRNKSIESGLMEKQKNIIWCINTNIW